MRNYDFAPLYRSGIGFDHLSALLESVNRDDNSQPSYPPYNIELIDKDEYQISMAVAGFNEQELDIQTENQSLVIAGKKADAPGERKFLHQGIAARSFMRKFQLADHVEVTNARLENGLLHIDLERRIPEAMKPKKIAIRSIEPRLVGDSVTAAA